MKSLAEVIVCMIIKHAPSGRFFCGERLVGKKNKTHCHIPLLDAGIQAICVQQQGTHLIPVA